MSVRTAFLLLTGILVGAGCQQAYYTTMEKFGVHKRDILVDRVQEARDSQQEAKEQFRSALERFASVVDVEGGELQARYEQLREELDRSEDKAEKVRKRIASVADVAEALFAEWEAELDQYSSAELRRSSEDKLRQTRASYADLMAAMRRAEARIDPVLRPLRDQVLFLKHNLNARAVASLQAELASVETDVAALVAELEAAIQEADAFIGQLQQG